MQRALGLVDDEVVDQGPVAVDGLGAHARRPAFEVARFELGDEAARLSDERSAADRAADLGRAASPVAAHHPPRPRPAEAADEQGGGPEQHLAVMGPGQVRSEERQVGVWHRVDVGPDQPGALGAQPQVAAAEGDDARIGGRAGGDGEAIRGGARAGDDEPGSTRLAPRPADRDAGAVRVEARHPPSGLDSPARLADLGGERGRDGPEVDDARVRGVQRCEPAGVRLDLGDLAGLEAAQARHAVLGRPALEPVERAEL